MTDDRIALRELLEKGSDAIFPREMTGFAAQRLMELETEGLCGAIHGERSAERVNQRDGHRERDWQTRAGTVELTGRSASDPKLRRGSYFPGFLELSRTAEQALSAVERMRSTQEAYVQGISTRSVASAPRSTSGSATSSLTGPSRGRSRQARAAAPIRRAARRQGLRPPRSAPLECGADACLVQWLPAPRHPLRAA